MTAPREFDVIVIGGGSGLTAAGMAADDGRSVALVEARSDALGGTCVNRGCIPTKGLVQAAEVAQTIRDAGQFGIEVDPAHVRVDFSHIMQTVRKRRESDASDTRSWVEHALTPFYAAARFVGDKLIELDDGAQIWGDRIFICTGARPAIPSIEGLDEVPFLTNRSVLELSEQPASIIIVGGGYVGCELAHFFAALSTDVTIVDSGEHLLDEDHEISAFFTEQLARRVDVVRGSAAAVRTIPNGIEVDIDIDARGEQRRLRAARLLAATGRQPNTEGLDLRETGVTTREGGFIQVNRQLRTTHPAIFAYGDVIGQGMFKHTSSYEGGLAYRNAFGADEAVSYRKNPHAVFSNPQVASVGLTETQCRQRGIACRPVVAEYADVAKGRIVGSPPGIAKLIVGRQSDLILGFHIAGPHAAIVIHEVVVAMQCSQGAAAVRDAIHIHPTLSELVGEVFDRAVQE